MSISTQFTEPWLATDHSHSFVAELQRELSPEHPLFGQRFTAVARRVDCDDVLFRIEGAPERFAVVHLTWRGQQELSARCPGTEIFDSIDQFVERRMRQDSSEYGMA